VIIQLSAERVPSSDIELNDITESRRIVCLTVIDTGKGISKDFMDNHLFVPFTQEDTATSNGVGLGMSIVKSLVSLLSGEIRVDSEVAYVEGHLKIRANLITGRERHQSSRHGAYDTLRT
jgi:signal transduction histidine kinase